MKRRRVLGALAGGAVFLLTGCGPAAKSASKRWRKGVGHGVGEIVSDIAANAAWDTAKDAITEPSPNNQFTQYSCPDRFPHNCGDYCCYSGSDCCAGPAEPSAPTVAAAR